MLSQRARGALIGAVCFLALVLAAGTIDNPGGGGGGGGFTTGDALLSEVSVSGYAITAQAAAEAVGGGAIDPGDDDVSSMTRTVRFRAVLSTSDVTKAATCVLYSISDTTTIATLTSTSLTPETQTQALTIGAVGANQIPDAMKVYEVRLYAAGGTGAESAIIHSAVIDLLHVAP